MALLDRDSWSRRYELTFGLWLLGAECSYLTGSFDEAEQLIAELLTRGASIIDKAAAYYLKIDLHVVRSENPQAIESAVGCLSLFGIEMPGHPAPEQVTREYERVWSALGGRSIESLIDLPPMTNPEMQAVMRVLSSLYAPAYFTDVNLVYLYLCVMMNITLTYGLTDASASAFAWFGVILGPAFNRYDEGYRFGRLARDLVEKRGLLAFKARTYFALEMVSLWTQPVEAAIEAIRIAYAAGVESGDLGIACYSCNHAITDMFAHGDRLHDVWRETENGLDFARKAKFRDVVDIIVSQQRFILNMQGRTAHFSTFGDASFDEEAFEAELTSDRMATMVCWYWILKLQARFLSGDYSAALAAARKAETLLWSSDGHIQLLDYTYYSALAIAAAKETVSAEMQADLREALSAHLRKLGDWSENGAATFRDKYALVAAEVARLEGRELEAERLYEEAIRLARENGFVQNEAIANELASRFYAARGFAKIARVYLQDARHSYLQWGADGKARQLEELYPQLREHAPGTAGTIGAAVEQLDLATVITVSQAVSSEIVPEKLIDTVLRTAMAQAGAERGLLILSNETAPRVEAEATTGGDKVVVRLIDEPVTAAELPEPVLQYVLRTREILILDDAASQPEFAADPYIRERRARSILCAPLITQAKLIGALYLENNLAPRVFASARVAALKLLASQAAVALENTRLYRELREREARIRRLVDANIIGIFIFDFEGRIIEANDAFLRMVGYDRNDLVSGRVRWMDLTPPEWRERHARAFAELKNAGTVQPYEREYFRKDGRRAPALIGSARFEEGANEGVAFVLDLAEHKRATEALRQVQMELAHANRVATIGQLTASIAHEVSQPIAAAVTNAQTGLRWLGAKTPDLGEVQQSLELIIRDATRASDVLARLRALMKKDLPRKEGLDINEAIGEVIELTRSEALKTGVSVEMDSASGLPLVEGDRVQLQQVVLNLVVNAVQAMGEVTDGARELLVTSALANPDHVLVTVRDSGPGLAPGSFKRIFDPFYSTKSDGLGMGLSICRSIIEAHQGRLWAAANQPRGASFHFTVPVHRAGANAPTPAPST